MIERQLRAEPSETAANMLRDQADLSFQLLGLAEHLPEEDRVLLQAVYDRGMRPSEFAKAIRVRPRSIRLRIRRIVARVGSPMYQFVVGQRDSWPEPRRTIAELVILRGESQREVARRLGVSLHCVRQEVSRLRAQSEFPGRGS